MVCLLHIRLYIAVTIFAHLLCTILYFITFVSYRISTIKFGFKFDATYDKGVIEEYNSVQVNFHIAISMDNKQYNNLEVDTDTTSTFRRIDNNFWDRKRTTIIDIVVLILLAMSFYTYAMSIFRSTMLTKVIDDALDVIYICDLVCEKGSYSLSDCTC